MSNELYNTLIERGILPKSEHARVTGLNIKLKAGEPVSVEVNYRPNLSLNTEEGILNILEAHSFDLSMLADSEVIMMEELKKVFIDKFQKTMNLDEALIKSNWVAFLKGIAIGAGIKKPAEAGGGGG